MAHNIRYNPKRDGNQLEIVRLLREAHCSVVDLSTRPKGLPDLLIGYGNYSFLAEIKDKGGKLSEDQKKFKEEWRGGKVIVARSFDELWDEIAYGFL
jgi:hypothetical protein